MSWKKIVVRTTEYIFYGITLVQVVFGLVWAFNQFPHMQNWQESYEYLDISRTWIMDEYVSFLYPLLLKLCTGIESVIAISFYMWIYVIQLAAIISASWFFVRKALKLERSKAVWAVGYLTSFPMLLQFHMSVRTESLEVSGILMLIAFFEVSPIGAAVMTLLLFWLSPDMVIIMVAAWIVYLLREFIRAWKEKKTTETEWNLKEWFIRCGAFLLALVIGLAVNGLVQTPGSRGKIQKTFWAVAFQRVVTEYFSQSYAMWDTEVRDTYTIEEAMEMAKRSDNMMCKVGPALEEKWGKKKANELYRRMTIDCFSVRTKDIVFQIRDDFADSALMPFSIWWQDNGERMSQTGWNYGRMRENSPCVTPIFLEFSISGLIALLVCSVLKFAMSRKAFTYGTYFVVLAFVQCVQSVFGAGNRVNYSMLLFVIFCWCYLAVSGTINGEEKYISEIERG